MNDVLTKNRFPTPVDQSRVAADWHARGYSCGLFVDPPGRAWNDFVHDTNELVTVEQGKLALTVGEQCVIAEPGDKVFIPARCLHSVKNINDGTTRWLYGYD